MKYTHQSQTNNSPARHIRRGFTLFELVVSMLLIGLLATFMVRSSGVPPVEAVSSATLTFAASMQQARTEGLSREEDGVFLVDEGSFSASGRFRALTVPAAGDTAAGTSADSSRWVLLGEGVRFGTGAAQGGLGPMGDTVVGALQTREVRCPVGNRCRFGVDSVTPWVTYYFTHEDRADVVQAVVVSAQGSARTYRYRSGGWQ